jgi:lysophospholipase L1-like esterase
MKRSHPITRLLPALALLLVIASGCAEESLLAPEPDAGPLFSRYVALGNSITAGYQSGGITASTQQDTYVALLADAMGTEFNLPLLQAPGCPPLIENVFTQERTVDGVACALRDPDVPRLINNVAVPGATVLDVLDNLAPASQANALTTFLLGGRTQLEAALDADPTFVSLWIGSNDVLGAALAGDPALLTPVDDFQARYSQILDALEAAGVQGGLLIGIPNVALIPNLSPGSAYFQAAQTMPGFSATPSCLGANPASPSDDPLVPFAYGFGELLSQAQDDATGTLGGAFVTLDCANDEVVLTEAEVAEVEARVAAFNTFIAQEATARGWAYYDPNPLLQAQREAGAIPLFPNTPPAPAAVTEPFGPMFSKDGVHPSSAAHRLIAADAIAAINEQYGTDIPQPSGSPTDARR